MENAVLTIVAMEAKHACEGEPDLTERIKKAMRVAKDHWMATLDDEQFRGALGGAMLASDEADQELIKASLRPLQALAAAMQGVPVDFERVLEGNPNKLIPLRKLWDEIQNEDRP